MYEHDPLPLSPSALRQVRTAAHEHEALEEETT
jgi:hypothetical protein